VLDSKLAGNGKSQSTPASSVLARGLKAVKRSENGIRLVLRNAWAAIADINSDGIPIAAEPDVNRCASAVVGRVFQQVG
jgi:hypothetical protein